MEGAQNSFLITRIHNPMNEMQSIHAWLSEHMLEISE